MSTIVEVSILAGVSKATVSRVINGNESVSPQSRDKVLEAIATLNFTPSKTAQALATKRTNAVAVVFPESNHSQWGALLPVISKELQTHQKSLLLVSGRNDPISEYDSILNLQHQSDAVLLYSRTLSDKHLQRLNKEIAVPLVVMNRHSIKEKYLSVSINQSQLVSIAMQHLIAKEHRHIACISGPTDNPSGQARVKGYIESLYAAKLTFNPLLLSISDYQFMGGYQACRQLLNLKAKFTAIVCFNEQMALGAIKALKEYGKNVPQQISVVSIGNSPMGQHSSPQLTSVESPVQEMAKQAVALLLNQLQNSQLVESISLNGKLVVRKSVTGATPQLARTEP
ncbi:LacI family DNA-binding transcriptional regulator [Vibrio comitans]|uniref:LacI family transcriptional regulator n=1 Tax=Vibrio comitans NBRC 102076 TaxID=1219078 RepID=A0A4Y3IHT4_9VIBR|nr:LacI family DNA-binding transcriptional regulator [Vibrio comitans]GEA59079.1 LacI family transcriptional regulator [Vibrio comitans NBRC 102076]